MTFILNTLLPVLPDLIPAPGAQAVPQTPHTLGITLNDSGEFIWRITQKMSFKKRHPHVAITKEFSIVSDT